MKRISWLISAMLLTIFGLFATAVSAQVNSVNISASPTTPSPFVGSVGSFGAESRVVTFLRTYDLGGGSAAGCGYSFFDLGDTFVIDDAYLDANPSCDEAADFETFSIEFFLNVESANSLPVGTYTHVVVVEAFVSDFPEGDVTVYVDQVEVPFQLQVLPPTPPTCVISSPASQTVQIRQGESLSFSGEVTGGLANGPSPTTLQWSFPDGTPASSTSNAVNVTYAEPGTFTATLTGQDGFGQECTATRQVDVSTMSPPTARIISPVGNQTITVGDAVNFAGEGTSTNPDFQPQYSWNFGDGRTSSEQNPGAVTFEAAGVYTVTFVVRDGDTGLSSSPASVIVTVDPPRVPDADFVVQQPDPITVVVEAAEKSPDLVYRWDFGQGANPGSAQGVGQFGPIRVAYSSGGAKTISLRVEDPATGAVSPPSQQIVTVAADPEEATELLVGLADPNDPGQQSVAASLGTACAVGGLGGDCDALIAAAEAGDVATVQGVLSAVEAQDVSASSDVLSDVGRLQMGLIGSRMVALRRATTSGFDISGLTLNIDGTQISGRHLQSLSSALTNGGAASSDYPDFGRWGVFLSGRYTRGTRDETANTDGFRYRINGLTLGADYRFRDNLFIGAALGYADTDTTISGGGGKLESDGFSGTLYGVWYNDRDFFVDGSLTYGRGNYDQGRNIEYTLPASVPTRQTFDASFDGSYIGIAINAGREIRLENPQVSITPTARVQYVRADVDGFSERARSPSSSGAEWAVQIEDQKSTSLTSSLGAQIDYTHAQKWGVLIPFAGAEWVYEFDKSHDDVTGWFVNDSTRTRFSLPVDDSDSNYFNVTAGVAAQFTRGRSAFINYQRILGYSDLRQYSVNAGVRFEF